MVLTASVGGMNAANESSFATPPAPHHAPAPRYNDTVRHGLAYAIAVLECDASCADQRRLAGAAEAQPSELLAAARWLRYERAKRTDITGRAELEVVRRNTAVRAGLGYAVAMLRIDALAPWDEENLTAKLIAPHVLLAAADWIATRAAQRDPEQEH